MTAESSTAIARFVSATSDESILRCMGRNCVAFHERADYERVLDKGVLQMLHKLDNKTSLKNVQG
jgi:hypothetical protein